jgi:hypothetical protein
MEIMMSMLCMSSSAASRRKYICRAAWFAGAILFSLQVSMAQSIGPFDGLAGNWRGTGRVVGTKGDSEPIKCRATYTVSPDGAGLTQSLVCASDSYRFDIRSDVISNGSTVHGTWQETTRDANGDFNGRVRDGLFEGTVSGPGFSARLSLRTTGGKQVVSINPQGTDVTKVDITLTH